MSNALAIAAVTESLVSLLTNALPAEMTSASVTHVTPDQINNVSSPGINVFLYQVTPNTAWRNSDLPTRASDGSFLKKPLAALDLHYLITFYGQDLYLEQQRLLGAATLALHAFPTLPRSAIQAVQLSPTQSAPSDLDTQYDLIRFTPVVFSLEELSKLWSFLLKIDYVLSTAYLASVVLIEQDAVVPPPARRVVNYNILTQPIRQPVISAVVASPNAAAPINAGSDITLQGNNLTAPSGGATQVFINGTAQTPSVVTATAITLSLPGGLAAGPQTAQIRQPVIIGTPSVLHPGTGVASGLAAFVLNPVITAVTQVSDVGSPPGPGIAVTVVPEVQEGQSVSLYLAPQNPVAAAQEYSLGEVTAATSDLIFATPALPSGTYVVSVLVDGAQSPLQPGPGGPPPTIGV